MSQMSIEHIEESKTVINVVEKTIDAPRKIKLLNKSKKITKPPKLTRKIVKNFAQAMISYSCNPIFKNKILSICGYDQEKYESVVNYL